MIQVAMPEAQQHLPELLLSAERGEAVEIIAETGCSFRLALQSKPPAALVANPTWLGYPYPGSCEGLIEVSDDFDAPLDELKEYME